MNEMFVKDANIYNVHRCTLIHDVTLVLNLGEYVEKNFLWYNLSFIASEKTVERADVVRNDKILNLG